jgi:hypothetical protein
MRYELFLTGVVRGTLDGVGNVQSQGAKWRDAGVSTLLLSAWTAGTTGLAVEPDTKSVLVSHYGDSRP